jgi:O-antigen ligase
LKDRLLLLSAAFFVFLAVRTLFAAVEFHDHKLELAGGAFKLLGTGFFLVYLVAFWLDRSRGRWDLLLIAVMAGFLVQILRNVEWGNLAALAGIFQTGLQRATFGFATNRLGLFSALILLACLLLYRPLWGPPASARAVRWARGLFWVFMSCLSAGGLVFSQSRSAWLAAVLVIPLALAFELFRSHGTKARRLAPFILVAVLIAAGFFMSNVSHILKQRLAPGIDGPSVTGRLSLYQIAWENWKMRPLVGRGPGTSFLMIQRAGEEHNDVKMFDHLHNVLFDLAAQIGVVGIAFIGLSCYLIARQAFRTRHADAGDRKYILFAVGALAMMLVTGIVNQPFHSPHGVYLAGYLGGICYSSRFADESGQDRPFLS